MPTNYPRQVQNVLKACHDFQNGEFSIEIFQALVLQGAEAVASVEEAEFRRFLQEAECKLELIRFTKDDARQHGIRIAKEIEDRVLAHLS